MLSKHPPTGASALSVSVELIERRIYLIRGHKVMLSPDLAELYNVEARALNQAVKRNSDRFPDDFMFQLTREESRNLKSHFVISRWGGSRRAAAYAFTQEGVAMLSSVLKSRRAVQVNIAIMRAFVRLREIMTTHKDLARKMEDLERTQREQGATIDTIFGAIKKLLAPPAVPAKPRIGFKPE
jgi:hypothetical protein